MGVMERLSHNNQIHSLTLPHILTSTHHLPPLGIIVSTMPEIQSLESDSPIVASSLDALTEAALFGFDATQRIVSVETGARGGLTLYQRSADGAISTSYVPYRPWTLLIEKPDFAMIGAHFSELEGDGFRVLAEFPTPELHQQARKQIRERHLASVKFASEARMALIRTGMTLFKGMLFEEVVRMQFDLETNGLDPEPEENRILLIVVSDNRGLMEIIEGDEADLLEKFVEVVQELDPDVLEGHNIFGFDLPYLQSRARRHGVHLALGRDQSELKQAPPRDYAIGGNTRPFSPFLAYGRHFIDTFLVVQRFDWAKGDLTSYGLKECARQFGFALQDRIEPPRDQMAKLYREQPEMIHEYARQDAIETGLLSELITPVEFYQTQMVPDNFWQVAVCGSGTKINLLLTRAYLAAGHAIPQPQPAAYAAGGYTEVRTTGVLDRIVKADVESLYPSLMLANKIAPASDTLGVFLPMLGELTRRRLEAKHKAKEIALAQRPFDSGDRPLTPDANLAPVRPLTPDSGGTNLTSTPHHSLSASLPHSHISSLSHHPTSSHSFAYWDGLQNSFKVLINSFYGYLGATPFAWNDPIAAGRITELGRGIVQQIALEMEKTGSLVIEIDTDGVYFVPPEAVKGEKLERDYISMVGKTLPEGIRLAFDGRYAKMISIKAKNYVLQTYENKTILKGASLRSRADERYGRQFLEEAIQLLLAHDITGASELYARTIDDLLNRRIPIANLARRERVTSKTFNSGHKQRTAAVAQGVALGDYVRLYEKIDGSLALLENYAQDENIKLYMEKLYRFVRRLEAGFEGDFDALFPKPTVQGLPHKFQTKLEF